MDNQGKKIKTKKGFYNLCLKEFKFCATAAMIYILISCLLSWLLGYRSTGEEMTYIAGVPTWAAIGVVLPWVTMVIVTTVYAFKFMEGDDF